MQEPSAHLLRTFAAVAPGSRVLVLVGSDGRHVAPLAQLGFDILACGPDAAAVDHLEASLASSLKSASGNVTFVHTPNLIPASVQAASCDWAVVHTEAFRGSSRGELVAMLAATHDALKPGGWVFVGVDAMPRAANPNAEGEGYAGDSGLPFTFTADTLRALLAEAALAEAEAPRRVETPGGDVLEAIFRRVDHDTIG